MTVTLPQVEASRPETLTHSGDELRRSAAELDGRIATQRTTLDALTAAWRGAASDAAMAKAQPTLDKMQRMYAAMTRLQATLHDGGNVLTASRTTIVSSAVQLRQQGWQVAPDGSVSARPGSTLDTYARLSPVKAMVVRQGAAANGAAMKSALAAFDSADRRVGQDVRGTVAGLAWPASTLGADDVPDPPPDTGPVFPDGKGPVDGKDPVEVRDWWYALTDAERDRLLAERPEMVGNLDGIPVAGRDAANQAVMRQDVDRIENRAAVLGVTVDQLTADPLRYGVATTDVTRYANARQVRAGLAHGTEQTDAKSYLYVYQPEAFDGSGRAAIAIGNPDNADNTTVVVPGTSNSVRAGWLSGDDATTVFNETKAADRGRTNAVVAWMGYDAPDSLADPEVAQTRNAREGGDLLARDINALEATNGMNSHVTVIGHSYGSTMVADACAGSGLRADDVVLIGSPGTDLARNAADFRLPEGGHVYVGSASTDVVTHLGGDAQLHVPGTDVTIGLGPDPAEHGFGSTRFRAEVLGITDPITDHTSYLDPGSESLFSIADIASGHGDALQNDGMTARHRFTIPILDVDVDPELLRPPTGDHHH